MSDSFLSAKEIHDAKRSLEEQLAVVDAEEREAAQRYQETAARVREVRHRDEAADKEKTRSLVADMFRLAERATGLTAEQLEQRARDLNGTGTACQAPIDPFQRARRRMKGANVPERFVRAVGDQEPQSCPALDAVRAFMADPQRWCLVLSGAAGTMKTGSACWALAQLEGGEYLETIDLLAVAIEDKARWLRLRKAPLVVLDDIGTEGADSKGAFVRYFHALANGVYGDCRKLILPCNVMPDRFKAEYGERLVDRIRDGGTWFEVGGQSVRGQR